MELLNYCLQEAVTLSQNANAHIDQFNYSRSWWHYWKSWYLTPNSLYETCSSQHFDNIYGFFPM